MAEHEGLGAELRNLRRGRGMDDPQIRTKIGPALTDLCLITPSDTPAEVRHKLAATVDRLAAQMPLDLRMAVRVALATHPEARLPFYENRIRWLADKWHLDQRTVRRRIDVGFVHLVEVASRGGVEQPYKGWWVEELRSVLLLDQPQPEAIEVRRIVSGQYKLSDLDLRVGQPQGAQAPQAQALYGAALTPYADNSFGIRLPVALNANDPHEFALRYRLAPVHQSTPYFVCRPEVECERFDIRVRFDVTHLPRRIERVDGRDGAIGWGADWDASGNPPTAEVLSTDAVGEVRLYFRRLTPGLAYGIRWLSSDPGPAFETH